MNEQEQSNEIEALESINQALLLTVPAKPTDLSDDDLDKVVGGDSIDSGHEGG